MSWGPCYQSGGWLEWKAPHIVTARRLDAFQLFVYILVVRVGGQQSVSDGGGGPTHHSHGLVLPRGLPLHPGHHQSLLLTLRPAGYQDNPAVRWTWDLTEPSLLIFGFSITAVYYAEILFMYVHILHIWYEYTWLVFPSITDQIHGLCPVPPRIKLQIWLRLRPGPGHTGPHWEQLPNCCSRSLSWSDQS